MRQLSRMRGAGSVAIAACVLTLAASPAYATSPPVPGNPGSPNVSCGSGNAVTEPHGFTTSGFQNAASHYAGSPGTASAQHSNSTRAVAQYDIACFQQTQRMQRSEQRMVEPQAIQIQHSSPVMGARGRTR